MKWILRLVGALLMLMITFLVGTQHQRGTWPTSPHTSEAFSDAERQYHNWSSRARDGSFQKLLRASLKMEHQALKANQAKRCAAVGLALFVRFERVDSAGWFLR